MFEYLNSLEKNSDGYVIEIVTVDKRVFKDVSVKCFDIYGIVVEIIQGGTTRVIPWTSIVFMDVVEG
jgi:hypothetical protein